MVGTLTYLASYLLHVGHIFPTPDIWNCVVKNPSSCSIWASSQAGTFGGLLDTFVPGGPKDAQSATIVAILLPLKTRKTVLMFTEISMKNPAEDFWVLRPPWTENRAEKTLLVD